MKGWCVCGCDFVCVALMYQPLELPSALQPVGAGDGSCLIASTPGPHSMVPLGAATLPDASKSVPFSPQVSFGCGGASHPRTPLFRWEWSARRKARPSSCFEVSLSFPSLGVMRVAPAAAPFDDAALIWSTLRVLGAPGSVLRWIGVIITPKCAAHIESFLFSHNFDGDSFVECEIVLVHVDSLDDVMDAWPAGEERAPLSLCKPQLQEHPRSSLSVVCFLVLDQTLWFLARGGEKFELQGSQVRGERFWQESNF